MRGELHIVAARAAALSAAMAAGGFTSNQDLPAAASPQTAERCELHVWPSEGLGSVRQTDASSGLIGLIASNAENKGIKSKSAQNNPAAGKPDAPLSPMKQRQLLADAPLADLLGLSGYRVVVHDVALDTLTIRNVKTRYVRSDVSCYADLVIDDTTFTTAGVGGVGLRSFIRFRKFGPDASPTMTYGTWVNTGLKQFSLADATPSDAAVGELNAAFGNNLTQFGRFLNKPVRKKK